MSEPFLSEIKIFSMSFAPRGWAFCNGQLLPINENQALFSLLGTTYGGNGTTNFALPNLQGRVAIHVGGGHTRGESAGEENHTLTISELPTHVHSPLASSLDGDQPAPTNNLLAGAATAELYSSTATNLTPLLPATISSVGGSQTHDNRQPFLVLSFCIALTGVFPTST